MTGIVAWPVIQQTLVLLSEKIADTSVTVMSETHLLLHISIDRSIDRSISDEKSALHHVVFTKMSISTQKYTYIQTYTPTYIHIIITGAPYVAQ